jgi:hypothetical protein
MAPPTTPNVAPVAWRYQSEDPLDGGEWFLSDTKPNRRNIEPLYAAPASTDAAPVATVTVEMHCDEFAESDDDAVKSYAWSRFSGVEIPVGRHKLYLAAPASTSADAQAVDSTGAQGEPKLRDLTDDDMDKVVTWLGEHDAESLGIQGLCENIAGLYGITSTPASTSADAQAAVALTNGQIIAAIRVAGAHDREWKALTYETGPYDVTMPTLFVKNFIDAIRALDAAPIASALPTDKGEGN